MTVHVRRRRPRPLDVVVRWSGTHTATDLAAVLAEHLGEPVPFLTASGRTVDASTHVGMPPLVHGASVAVGQGAPFPDLRALPGTVLDLAVVGGPDSGRSCPLNSTGPAHRPIRLHRPGGRRRDPEPVPRNGARRLLGHRRGGRGLDQRGRRQRSSHRRSDGHRRVVDHRCGVVDAASATRRQDAGLPLHPSGDGRLEVRPPAAPDTHARRGRGGEPDGPRWSRTEHGSPGSVRSFPSRSRSRSPWCSDRSCSSSHSLVRWRCLRMPSRTGGAPAARTAARRLHMPWHCETHRSDCTGRCRTRSRGWMPAIPTHTQCSGPLRVVYPASGKEVVWPSGWASETSRPGWPGSTGRGESTLSPREHRSSSTWTDVGCLGVVGPPQVTDRLLANIVGQLCTRHPPDRLIVTVAATDAVVGLDDAGCRTPCRSGPTSQRGSGSAAVSPPRGPLGGGGRSRSSRASCSVTATALVVTAATNAGALPSAVRGRRGGNEGGSAHPQPRCGADGPHSRRRRVVVGGPGLTSVGAAPVGRTATVGRAARVRHPR